MHIEEWIEVTKNLLGPTEFRQLGLGFLREYFGCPVMYTDGTGDGGIDAWVVLRSEPPVRVAAQFHAGKTQPWDSKLADDLSAMAKFRDMLAADDARRLDFAKLYFVCAQTPSQTKVETVAQEMLAEHGIAVRVFDARAIVSLALEQRGALLDVLARGLPESDSGPVFSSALDEVLVAFSLFHESPAKYRWAVVKSGIATVLQHQSELDRAALIKQTASLLRISEESTLIERTLRNLEREHLVEFVEGSVRACPELGERTKTAQLIAGRDRDTVLERCADALDPHLPPGLHHRKDRARRAAECVLGDLGMLVRRSVVDRAVRAIGDRQRLGTKAEDEARARWFAMERRLGEEMGIDSASLRRALKDLVRVAAESAYAKSLASAELFLRLTEHDASEFARALETPSQQVLIDASIAMPMLCALYDRPAEAWQTSVAAHMLYVSLRERGISCVVPAVYVEEMASHLLLALRFTDIVEEEVEIERSGNYFVAHFCSTRRVEGTQSRSRSEYRQFLRAFGAERLGDRSAERIRAQREITSILRRYGFEVLDIACSDADPVLTDEPQRPEVLLRHDRAVVRAMQTAASRGDRRHLVCTADQWLQGVFNDLGVTALDGAGLLDLSELIRPIGVLRSLQSPLLLASAIGEEERALAAQVWDEIVAIEDGNLSDWRLVEMARAFQARWLDQRRDTANLRSEWAVFRGGPIHGSRNSE